MGTASNKVITIDGEKYELIEFFADWIYEDGAGNTYDGKQKLFALRPIGEESDG